ELSLAAAWKASVARTTEELAAARAELLHLREEAVTRTAGTSEQPNGNEAAAHEAELALLEEARLRLREACAAGDAALQGAQARRAYAHQPVTCPPVVESRLRISASPHPALPL
ncbi:unnamed protein product, partial [Prorocentrum cordatum]